MAARRHIMNANAVACMEMFHVTAHILNHTCNFVAECEGQGMDTGFTGTIVSVRMADTRRLHANKDIVRAGMRHGHVVKFQRTTLVD